MPGAALVVDQLPAALPALQPLDRHLRPVEVGAPDQFVEQHRVAAVDRAEHRLAGGRRQRRADRVGQAPRAAVQHCRQRRGGRPQPDGGGRARIHAGQQGVDGPGHHLFAEPVADEFGDRGICTRPPGQRPRRLVEHPPDGGVVHQAGHRCRVGRNAVEGVARQLVKAALAVDQRPHTGRTDLPAGQAQLGEQRRHLGPPGDERLGADVDRLAADLLGAQHAAEPIGGLEYGDVRVVAEGDTQPVRGDKP